MKTNTFNKERCINNIYDLAKKKKLKIGEIEEKAGVSKGYLSRINKEGSKANPPIDFLASVAEQLDVSVDYLLMYSAKEFNRNESFVYEFIDRLSKQTAERDIEWIVQTRNVLTAEGNDPVDNPLITPMPSYSEEFDREYICHNFMSRFFGGSSVIADDCYFCQLLKQENARIYLMSVCYYDFMEAKSSDPFSHGESKDAYELYLCDQNDISPICSTAYVREEIAEAVRNLYETVSVSSSRMVLTRDASVIMKKFLNS